MSFPGGRQLVPIVVASIALVAASCSSGSSSDTADTAPPDTEAASSTEALDAASETTVAETPQTDPVVTEATDPPPTDPPATDPPPTDPPRAEATSGQACVASREGVSCLQDDGSWVVHDESTGLSNNFVTAFDVCDTGELIVSNSSALDLYDGTRWVQLAEPFEFGGLDHLQCTSVDDIWAGGFDEAAHWDGSAWELFAPEVFGDGILEDLELGPDGQPWFGSTEGIYTYDGSDWTVYDESNSFENHSVDDMSFAPNGRLEAVLLLTRATFENGTWVESDYNGTATAIAADDNTVLIGTFNRGVDVISGGATATLDRASGDLPTDKIQSMTVDAQGRVWVGTQYGLVVLQDGAVLQTFRMDNSGIHDNLVVGVSVQGTGPSSLDGLSTSPTNTFSGVITDGVVPIDGAAVEICVLPLSDSFEGATPCDGQPISFAATTGPDGAFAIPDVPRGRYVFVVNTGNGWIQATGQFGLTSERVLIDQDLDIGIFAAVADEE
jgi:hypothetical protein